MRILLFLTFPCQMSAAGKRLPPFCSPMIKKKAISRLRSGLFQVVCVKRTWAVSYTVQRNILQGFSLLFTQMVRTLHQHLHAVDRDDAHAQQADGSQLQQ